MTCRAERAERRRHERIQIENRADAVLFSPMSTKGIQIVDISRGGLAFHYVNGREVSNGLFEIDILWDHVDLKLIKLKVRTISDHHVPNSFLLGVIPLRRCGVEFVGLTEDQMSRIEDFIRKRICGDG